MRSIGGVIGSGATIAVFVGAPVVFSELGVIWAGAFVLGVVLVAWGLSRLLRRDEAEQTDVTSPESREPDPLGELRSGNQPAGSP